MCASWCVQEERFVTDSHGQFQPDVVMLPHPHHPIQTDDFRKQHVTLVGTEATHLR